MYQAHHHEHHRGVLQIRYLPAVAYKREKGATNSISSNDSHSILVVLLHRPRTALKNRWQCYNSIKHEVSFMSGRNNEGW